MPRMLVHMPFGSHLYGTNTPQSDMDERGVMLPNVSDILRCRAPRSYHHSTKAGHDVRNGPHDTDYEVYALHYFLELAYAGETVALDMLHAKPEQVFMWSSSWDTLHRHRGRFYTKNLKALVSYARKQAAKYGIKGTRIAATREALAFLKNQREDARLEDVWEQLPENEHCTKGHNGHEDVWSVCGKQLTKKARVRHYVWLLENFLARYGHRAKQAEQNQGIDWKAVMHAFRAAYQVRAILKDGDFAYPLQETPILRRIRAGCLDWATEASPTLDALLTEVDALSKASALPEQPDRAWGDEFLRETMEHYVGEELRHL